MSKTDKSYSYTTEDGSRPYVTIPDLLVEAATNIPNHDAAICWSSAGERTSITYSELFKSSELFAKGLSAFGYERNSIIAIETQNTPEWMISTFGTQMAGFVPLHFSFGDETGEDVVAILNSVKKCVAIIAASSSIPICKKIAGNLDGNTCRVNIPTLQNVFCLNTFGGDIVDINELIESGKLVDNVLPQIYADDICAIFFTSGSTGLPKAVPWTHHNLSFKGFAYSKLLEIKPRERFLSYFPFGWQGSYPITALCSATTIVTFTDIRKLKSVEEINSMSLKVLNTDRCVSAMLLTPGIFDLVKKEDIVCNSFPLRVVCTVGLPVDAICSQIIGQKAEKFAVGYGSTELGLLCAISVNSSNDYENYAVGKPIPGTEVKILDDKGIIVQRGTVGEIYIRTRDRFLGYLNAKEKSDICCEQTGWFKTDDVGMMKADGSVIVTGRKSDVMIISGDLVSPSYLEGILKEHNAVADAFVYPIYDQGTFEQACAAIVIKSGKNATEEELKSFVEHQRGRYAEGFLATRFVPKHVLFFHSFPTTNSGKVDRKALAAAIRNRLKT